MIISENMIFYPYSSHKDYKNILCWDGRNCNICYLAIWMDKMSISTSNMPCPALSWYPIWRVMCGSGPPIGLAQNILSTPPNHVVRRKIHEEPAWMLVTTQPCRMSVSHARLSRGGPISVRPTTVYASVPQRVRQRWLTVRPIIWGSAVLLICKAMPQ